MKPGTKCQYKVIRYNGTRETERWIRCTFLYDTQIGPVIEFPETIIHDYNLLGAHMQLSHGQGNTHLRERRI